jgi:hypothetical protein
MRGQSLLVGLLLILMPIPFPASANIKHLPTPVHDLELVLWRASGEVPRATINRQYPITNGSLVGTEMLLIHGASPPSWPTDERQWQVKDTNYIRPLEACKKHKAGPVCTRLAEARIEGLKEQQPVTSRARRIPTIQLLDCRTLTEEEVCKGLMCTWEAARCHETTGNTGPPAAPPKEEPPR